MTETYRPAGGRFETQILTTRKNLKFFTDVLRKWIDRVRQRRSLDKLILGLNSSVGGARGLAPF